MKTTFLTILFALSFTGVSAQEQYEAFRDVNLPMHERIMDLLGSPSINPPIRYKSKKYSIKSKKVVRTFAKFRKIT